MHYGLLKVFLSIRLDHRTYIKITLRGSHFSACGDISHISLKHVAIFLRPLIRKPNLSLYAFYTKLSLTINIWKAGWENACTESVQRNVSCIKMGGICLQQKTAGNIHACQLQPIKPTLKYKTEQTSSCNMLSFNIFNNAISATINHRILTTLPKDTYQTWAGRQKGDSLDPWATLHKAMLFSSPKDVKGGRKVFITYM